MTISFGFLGNHGRLGNCLFQINSTMGLAEKYGTEAVFPPWAYEQYFEPRIKHGPKQATDVKEQHFNHYDWELQGDVDMYGYLQSEKYFGSTRLKLKESFVKECKKKYNIFDKQTICIQIRRGDYVGNPNYYQLPVTFYISALLTYFPNLEDYNLLFISDDIEYCRVHFECLPNATFSKGNSDIEDMALGSCCDHFIISNSTFGWWTAWFGEKENSKIIHSGHCMAGPLMERNPDTSDYRPERWIEFKKDTYRIPLKDITITIPVFMDHNDRKQNLDLTLCLLQKDFDSNFIICEQGGSKFEYTSQWAKYIQEPLPYFHRTKMLNDMAILADTELIANWDCDVIIPPMQVVISVERLRAGADVVFPYDGRFARLPRIPWFQSIQKSLDIGIVKNQMFRGREKTHNSVGGAVLFRKDSFIEGGMENENMISFGPEDCERNDRFKMLGFKVLQIPGSLFHINHFTGVNSSSLNPHFRKNHQELEKMRLMSRQEMQAYVETWPWRMEHLNTSSYFSV